MRVNWICFIFNPTLVIIELKTKSEFHERLNQLDCLDEKNPVKNKNTEFDLKNREIQSQKSRYSEIIISSI